MRTVRPGRMSDPRSSATRTYLSVAMTIALAGCGAAPPPAEHAQASEPERERSEPDTAGIVEAELDRLVAEGATRATIVVLDPQTGRVLAASGRGPEGTAEADRVDEMGSTLKPLTVAAALDAGLDPMRRFSGEGGAWQVDASTLLRDAHPRESFDAQDVLVASSNVGAAKIVEAVGEAPVASYFAANRVEVPAPASWLLHGAGIGAVTSARRLAAAYAVFANGGRWIEPTSDGSGRSHDVLSAPSARAIARMLEAAVGEEGTGRRAQIQGVRVAGKTGTTASGAAVFAGFAPVDEPRYVVVVRAERTDGAWGGAVAAPSFARVAAALLAPPSP
ncbi:MAG: hypothetical protein K8H88_18205 [Sandaracinaceae bacterium]|nr:hypothetical protein [Sandaracinaceae bacterium]